MVWRGRREPGRAGPVYEEEAANSPETPTPGTEDGECERALAANGTSGTSTDSDRRRQQQQQQGRRLGIGIGKRPRASPPSSRPPALPSGFLLNPVTVRGRPLAAGDRVRGATVSTPPLRKLLFSATLTNNPQKLAGLDVVNPLIYTARETTRGRAAAGRGGDGGDDAKRPSQETRRSNLDDISLAAADGEGGAEGRFSTPATLEETYTVCDSQVWVEGGRRHGGVLVGRAIKPRA